MDHFEILVSAHYCIKHTNKQVNKHNYPDNFKSKIIINQCFALHLHTMCAMYSVVLVQQEKQNATPANVLQSKH